MLTADELMIVNAYIASGCNVPETARKVNLTPSSIKSMIGRPLIQAEIQRLLAFASKDALLDRGWIMAKLVQCVDVSLSGIKQSPSGAVAALKALCELGFVKDSNHGEETLSDDERRRRVIFLLESNSASGAGQASKNSSPNSVRRVRRKNVRTTAS